MPEHPAAPVVLATDTGATPGSIVAPTGQGLGFRLPFGATKGHAVTRFSDPGAPPGHRRPLDRNRVIVLAVVIVVALVALWAITTGAIKYLGTDEDNPTPAPSRTSTQPTVGSTAAVTDGDLEMRLVGVASNGPRELTVTVTVRNRTTAFVSFYGESQQVISTESRTARGAVSLTSLEPRETARVTLVFALPPDFRAAELDLHSTPSSPGVRVKLS